MQTSFQENSNHFCTSKNLELLTTKMSVDKLLRRRAV